MAVLKMAVLKMPGTLLAAALATTSLVACEDGTGTESSGPSVVAGFYPLAFVAERVAGEHASVDNLSAAGAEPHDLELSPRQVASLTEADLVVFEAGFQPAVDETIEQEVEGNTLDVAEVAELEGGADDLDPHFWQDPTRLVPVARAVGERLAEANPDHADDYRANAEELANDLTALDKEFSRGLADCERRTFVTSHEAFGYLAERYDLEQVAIAGLTPDSEPSPARLAELRDLVEQEGVTTVFTERLADPALAETLADEAGVGVGTLDPLEGLTDETQGEDYLSLMRANLDALRQANGCS